MTYFRLLIILLNILYKLQSVLSYTLIKKLPLGKGALDIESIEYDETNNEYLIASWYEGTIIPFTEAKINNAIYDINNDSQWRITVNNYPMNIWRDSGVSETPFNNTNAIWNMSTWRPGGMQIINNKLYVVDFYGGRISKFDITTEKYESSVFITNGANMPANLDGLCSDPSNTNILYATDYGYTKDYESVYSINTNDWSYSIIYNVSTNINGADNEYTMKPNGCVVVNGILYTVDFNVNNTQRRGFNEYNIANKIWTVGYDILPETGADGLVYISEINTFYITDYKNGSLLKYENGIDNKFIVVYEGMNSPADMTYNNIQKILVIPEFNTGFVNFIQLDSQLFTTTTQYFTTTATTATTTQYLVETTESEDKPTKKPDDIVIDAAQTLGFIITCIVSLIVVLVV